MRAIMNAKNNMIIVTYIFLFYNIGLCQNSSGILYNNNNYSVKIIRNNTVLLNTSTTTPLFQKDLIVSDKLDKLKFNWAPYANGTIKNDSTLEVTLVSPNIMKGRLSRIIETISNYMGFIKEDFFSKAVAQRGNDLVDSPDSSITAVDFLPIKFTCPGSQSFSVYDINNKQVFLKNTKGILSFEIIPKELNIKLDELYCWKIVGGNNGREGKFRLLNNDFSSTINSSLSAIDKSTKDKSQRILKKASYLQMLSDIYKSDLDLYWLSNQMLDDIDFSQNPEAQLIEKRYYEHLIKK
jgi:hypothetical protein